LRILGGASERQVLQERREFFDESLVLRSDARHIPAQGNINGLLGTRIEDGRRGGDFSPIRVAYANAQVCSFLFSPVELGRIIPDFVAALRIEDGLSQGFLASQIRVEDANETNKGPTFRVRDLTFDDEGICGEALLPLQFPVD